ncbi:MAG: cytochrome C [Roseovarius sp.]|nr:cytochrome C [Roseovarius sp.]MCY4208233.1 cytochrome C [Roseovarius sp.]MCY4292431.1 cytochrome C [Roseovarius sp.]MCY4317319.1 cytochrome C [Roseovarius sp.]
MKYLLAALTLAFSGSAAFAEGDPAKGEKAFRKCKSCHLIASENEVFMKGGKTGPNLYGIIGSQAGSVEGFKYSKILVARGEEGLVWDEKSLAEYIQDPTKFLGKRSNMTFRLKKGSEDVAAYLATFSK